MRLSDKLLLSTRSFTELSVEAKNLKKTYDDATVIDGISLRIQKGQCFGLLGPNGAGKSTFLRMVYGATQPSSGDLFVLGLNVKSSWLTIKARIGVVPQEDGLEMDFTARENLRLFAKMYGIEPIVAQERAEELIHMLHLEGAADKRVAHLSGGNRRRLAIARGLIHRPELLILDEPTSGLDPQARLFIWSHLQKIKSEMGSVILSTHYMEEAENVCDQVAIMDQGRILEVGTPKDLIAKWAGFEVIEFVSNPKDLSYDVEQIKKLKLDHQVLGPTIRVFVKVGNSSRDVLPSLLTRGVTVRPSNLNDVFLRVTGHELREVWQ